jgi:predicted neutral ceramidase superfamily lipid hydrolase
MDSAKEQLELYEQVIMAAIRRYGWVVGFPSFWSLLGLLLVSSLLVWLMAWILLGSSLVTIPIWVFGFAIAPLLLDSLFLRLQWYSSPILDRRRLVAISVVCNSAFLFCVSSIGGLGVLLGQNYTIKVGTVFGMWVYLAIRLAALSVLGGPGLKVGSTSLYFLIVYGTAAQALPSGLGWLEATVVTWLLSSLYNTITFEGINRVGKRSIGIQGLDLLHAFLASHLAGVNEEFERILDKLGEERDIDCRLVALQDEGGRNVLALASTSVHFGPFGTVGSSGLSHDLRLSLERRLLCPVVIVREVSDHAMDLVSGKECKKLIDEFPIQAGIEGLVHCSPLVTEVFQDHAASSLVTGSFCLTILSRAPIPTEDFPSAARDQVHKSLSSLGYEVSILVDAHNCIGDLLSIPQKAVAEYFGEAARRSAIEARKREGPFEVGFCRLNPPGITLDDGLGPDGLSAIAIKVAGEASAILVLDGNNMLVGLREAIIGALEAAVISSRSEVVTTDTHLVTGLTRVRGGYKPLGTRIGQETLVQLCKSVVSGAVRDAQPAKISITSGTVSGVRVVGSGLGKLADLLNSAFSLVKRYLAVSVPIAVLLSYAITLLI